MGWEYYVTGAAPGDGYRNGYRRGRLRTAEGHAGIVCRSIGSAPSPHANTDDVRCGTGSLRGWGSKNGRLRQSTARVSR